MGLDLTTMNLCCHLMKQFTQVRNDRSLKEPETTRTDSGTGGALEGVTSIYLSTDDPRPVFVSPRSCDFHFHVYFPGRNTTTTTISELLGIAPDTEIEQQATAHGAVVVTSLPALSLEGAWEHLVFRPRVQDDILRALVRLRK